MDRDRELCTKACSLEDGRLFCGGFFDYYNNAHRHSGLGLMTPAAVHYDFASLPPGFKLSGIASEPNRDRTALTPRPSLISLSSCRFLHPQCPR